MRRRLLVLGAAVAASTLAPVGAGAAETVVVAGPGAFTSTYATPVVGAQPGGTLTFANLDIDRHNVFQDVAVDGAGGPDTSPWCGPYDPGECPAFRSATIFIGQTTPVEGLGNLELGRVYSFYCTIHPFMKGKLVVLPDA